MTFHPNLVHWYINKSYHNLAKCINQKPIAHPWFLLFPHFPKFTLSANPISLMSKLYLKSTYSSLLLLLPCCPNHHYLPPGPLQYPPHWTPDSQIWLCADHSLQSHHSPSKTTLMTSHCICNKQIHWCGLLALHELPCLPLRLHLSSLSFCVLFLSHWLVVVISMPFFGTRPDSFFGWIILRLWISVLMSPLQRPFLNTPSKVFIQMI